MKKINASDGVKRSLLFKMAGISSILLLAALSIMAYMNLRSSRILSIGTAILMGTNKLKGDIVSFENILTHEYGKLSLSNGELVNSNGVSIKYDYRIVDEISSSLGVQATIFVRENEDFRRITTSIVDDSGNRAVDTFL